MKTLALIKRELLGYFLSPAAYVIASLFLFTLGLTISVYLSAIRGSVEGLYSLFGLSTTFSYVFWLLFLLLPPLICMRSISEEKRLGTYELLTTTGLSDSGFVVAKFAAAYGFYVYLWSLSLGIFLYLSRFGSIPWGNTASLYVGIFGCGFLFCSIGIFASSLTDNSLVAALVSLVINLGFFVVEFGRYLVPTESLTRFYVDYVSPVHHFRVDYSQGIVDIRYLFYYLTVGIVFLFVSVKVLEKRRWS